MKRRSRAGAGARQFAVRIEGAAGLDPIADKIAAMVPQRLRTSRARDLLSGTPIGHPAHPMLVAAPMGAWLSASVLDLIGDRGSRRASKRLIGVGVLTAVPAAMSGWSDWLDTEGAERRIGLAHAGVNVAAISLYAASWSARDNGRYARGRALALVGAGVLSVSGWLGGHLAYALGVGVDTTAFQHMTNDWQDVVDAASVSVGGSCASGTAAGTPILVIRAADGLSALADRCTHRGAPLHDGAIEDGCIVCPWHASAFDVSSGRVVRGPATRPQPVFEVRESGGRIQVRRREQRTLRTNPV